MSKITPITIAYGDGIGPEIMEAVLYILRKAEAPIQAETIEVGKKLYDKHYSTGIAEDSWNSIQRTKILFKAPITTPQGGGYKSLNVTLRKALGLYANIRPAIAYAPFIATKHPKLDVVIIRENEEDLYAGIEYRHTANMRESVKLISRTGCEKIINYAFTYAVKNNRQKVTCFSKDNIMKFSDGLFHQVFNEVAVKYPQIKSEHYIADIGIAKLAATPEKFDVIVTANLLGDIASDITAEISGSVGLAGSANIGQNYAMFEAIHGSAPDIAKQNIANPSGLLNAALMMLVHINQGNIASQIGNAWKKTIEDGLHTADIYHKDTSLQKLTTDEFAKAVVARLGKKPEKLKITEYQVKFDRINNYISKVEQQEQKKLIGVDIFVDICTDSAAKIAKKLDFLILKEIKLKTISSKGLKLWPHQSEYLVESDHWCCRFISEKKVMLHADISQLLAQLAAQDIDFIKVENLYNFDGKRGYSLAQGE